MSVRQQRRLEVLGKLGCGDIGVTEAGLLLGIGERQVRRAARRLTEEGIGSVVHGNTGRRPANRTPDAVRTRLVELTSPKGQGRYHDFNTCHLQELLAASEGIEIGRSTLDRLLKEVGTRKRSRGRPKGSFKRRERKPKEGEMLLIDGSSHDWLEGRCAGHKRLCLHAAVDDATEARRSTGKVVHARFWPTECQAGYIRMARELTLTYGVPESFYHDRHTILCSPKEPTLEDELAGREPASQFEAMLAQLGAESIKALTPQAKGRIERLFKTLQDRLVKEMRLHGACTLEEANAFLPAFVERHNQQFAVEPADPQAAWVVPGEPLDLPYFFAAKQQRVVRADHTLSWMGQDLQLKRKRTERSLAGVNVNVHTTPDGEVFVYLGKQRLAYQALTPGTRQADRAPGSQPHSNARCHKAADNTAKADGEAQPKGKPSHRAGTRAWLFAQR